MAMFQGAQQESFVNVEHPGLVAIVADADTLTSFEDMARMDAFLAGAMSARLARVPFRHARRGVPGR